MTSQNRVVLNQVKLNSLGFPYYWKLGNLEPFHFEYDQNGYIQTILHGHSDNNRFVSFQNNLGIFKVKTSYGDSYRFLCQEDRTLFERVTGYNRILEFRFSHRNLKSKVLKGKETNEAPFEDSPKFQFPGNKRNIEREVVNLVGLYDLFGSQVLTYNYSSVYDRVYFDGYGDVKRRQVFTLSESNTKPLIDFVVDIRDPKGRLSHFRTFFNGSSSNKITWKYEYDIMGRLGRAIKNNKSRFRYKYNKEDQLVQASLNDETLFQRGINDIVVDSLRYLKGLVLNFPIFISQNNFSTTFNDKLQLIQHNGKTNESIRMNYDSNDILHSKEKWISNKLHYREYFRFDGNHLGRHDLKGGRTVHYLDLYGK